MNRYIDVLKHTGQEMLDLAKRLGEQRAQPLKPHEARLIRLAHFGTAQDMLDAALYDFMAGKPSSPGLEEFESLCKDLKGP